MHLDIIHKLFQSKKEKFGLPFMDFHKAHKCPTALCAVKQLLKVCDSFQINSKLVWDCHQSLVKVVGVPGYMRTDGNEIQYLREGADKSLARPTSQCHRAESIVSLERGVCSCAELQVFSCYRG